MSTPLSHKQKGIICQVARQAFDHQIDSGALGDSAVFEDWRQEQQFIAAGHHSLTTCSQDHYGVLLARFQDLKGKSGAALKTLVRDEGNDKRIALYKLDEELQARGLQRAYADTICRCHNRGLSLDDASAKMIWRVIYTVRNSKHPRKVVRTEAA